MGQKILMWGKGESDVPAGKRKGTGADYSGIYKCQTVQRTCGRNLSAQKHGSDGV